jgi:hypothetical protein
MELHGYNIQPILELGFKLERAFQHITLHCQSCLTKFFPTLCYVQASTQTLSLF